jgi:molybdate transport system substrate-binding protein
MSEPSSRAAEVLALAIMLLACGRRGEAGETQGARRGDSLHVAAAADLALAFAEVGKEFEKASGKRVEFSYGSTGLLAKQISEGAPFDVFAAANISFVDDVVQSGACIEGTKALYAKGRIVLWAKEDVSLPSGVVDLADPRYAKVAIANPDHAPYGRAARQALERSSVWSTVQPRAVYGDNVQQTLMFAQSGNAEVAIVALSLAVVTPGRYTLIPDSLHEPLDQAMVVCKGGSRGPKENEARAFVAFVGSETGRAVMRRYGFLLPGEAAPR